MRPDPTQPQDAVACEHRRGTDTCLELVGALDADTSPGLAQRLHALLDAGVQAVELDFRQVTFVSSLGVGCLIAAFGDFHQAGRQLLVTGLSPSLLDMLRMLDLLGYIKAR
jgi:anti-anti-sigma factor